MKVALVDNMNNNFFALARYFRDLGIDADLYVIRNQSHPHFHPQEDTWQDLRKEDWIKEFPVSYQAKSYVFPTRTAIQKTFSQYDRIVACGLSLGLLLRAGIVVDLFIPYGSDLINTPFLNYNSEFSLRKSLRLPLDAYRSKLQKKGIQSAKKIIVNTNWSIANLALEKLRCEAINLPRIMIYRESPPPHAIAKYSWLTDYHFSVFSPTRHLWATNADPLPDFKENGGLKRNDKLIRAFARIVKVGVVERPLLLLCEYGADVSFSKRLIEELGIAEHVKWLPLLGRKEIALIMNSVTVVADQFRVGMSATSAGTTNEALACGKPIITNTDGALEDSQDPYFSSPILQAISEQEIYSSLYKLALSPDLARNLGEAGLKWFEGNLSFGLASKYTDLLFRR